MLEFILVLIVLFFIGAIMNASGDES